MNKTIITNSRKAPDFVTILGIKVNSTPKDELLKSVQGKLTKKIQFYIVTPNPEIILQAQSDPELTHSLNSSDFSLPDGNGLKFAEKNLKIIKGRDFMLDLFKIANDKKLRVYLLGSTPEVNKKALNILLSQYLDITAKGAAGPKLDKNAIPVSQVDTSLEFDTVKEINSFKPDLLFVAFGAPKQEIWIAKWLPTLKVGGAMAVGGSLDYYSGFVRPVPDLLANLNLEWLWRLLQEPKRIGRILKATIIFPAKVILSGNQTNSQG